MSDGDLIPLNAQTREELAYHAYQLRLGGSDWEAIRSKLGYKSVTAVRTDVDLLVKKALAEAQDDRKREVVELELDRLDALQNSIWGIALGGDIKAIEATLKIMAHRARLLALGQDTQGNATNTIIVASDNYVDTLKEISK